MPRRLAGTQCRRRQTYCVPIPCFSTLNTQTIEYTAAKTHISYVINVLHLIFHQISAFRYGMSNPVGVCWCCYGRAAVRLSCLFTITYRYHPSDSQRYAVGGSARLPAVKLPLLTFLGSVAIAVPLRDDPLFEAVPRQNRDGPNPLHLTARVRSSYTLCPHKKRF
jgi:hypothetical protein